MKKYAVILSNTVENVYIVEAANSHEAETIGVKYNNDPDRDPQEANRTINISVNELTEYEKVGDDEEEPTVSYLHGVKH